MCGNWHIELCQWVVGSGARLCIVSVAREFKQRQEFWDCAYARGVWIRVLRDFAYLPDSLDCIWGSAAWAVIDQECARYDDDIINWGFKSLHGNVVTSAGK